MNDFDMQRGRSKGIEEAVARWCMRRGGKVLPVYDYSGLADDKAPKLQALPASLSRVLPDLLVFRGRHRFWVEIKLKTRAIWTHEGAG